MNFNFVWAIIENLDTPPSSSKFKNKSNNYSFYPFEHKGEIITADFSLWDNNPNPKAHYWPSPEEIVEIISSHETKGTIVIVYSDKQVATTIDPNNPVNLSKIPEEIESILDAKFVDTGFDVIDQSGVSAITNIGYLPQDLLAINNQFKLTKYGLIDSLANAHKFADLASRTSLEHSPFYPVRISVSFGKC